jgi:hypothetical protein
MKAFGVALGIAAMAQVGVASASCGGQINGQLSACSVGGSSGFAERGVLAIVVDLVTGVQANAVLFTLDGAPIPSSVCTRPRDTAPRAGVLSAGAIRSCPGAARIAVVVEGP